MQNFISQVIPDVSNRFLSKLCTPSGQGIPPPSHEGGYKIYKTLFFLLGIPVISLAAMNAMYKKSLRECERPPFIKYEYLRKRDKRFPWGDGTKTFFHNPATNPLPDGYEDELD
ncbi:cytochrome c oxidase subunit 6A1, mitochondrial-like [Diorhabda carinulata]|uniref:cytochrome c oxidase subunit 6A1, mitochondrial-like n=1 Tax=Diorhabda carinulata TaxID=1163345 RepID=UPI0025A0B33C|nr:cytochrome c oxidase subunit 6A1, mitochondrial-like [Diorhabda carinulata]